MSRFRPRCHYVEVVGLIGAGKSTTLGDMRRCLPLYYPKAKVEVDVEAEDILDRFITPLLADVYKLLPGSERSEELAIEAVFASIRLIQVKALIVFKEDPFNFKKVLTTYSERLVEAFSLPTFMEESSLTQLRQNYQFLIARRRAALHGCEPAGLIVDRGLADILCFILERLNPTKTMMRDLFLKVYDEVLQLVFFWSPFGDTPRPLLPEDFVGLKKRFDYSVIYLSVPLYTAEERIAKRGRPCEVNSTTGKPLPRVLTTNARLEKIYRRVLPCTETFSQDDLVKDCLRELDVGDYSSDDASGGELAFVLPRLIEGIEPFDPDIIINSFLI